MFTKYHQAVKYLEDLALEPLAQDYMKRTAKDPGVYLKRMRYLLKLLNNPEQGFKFIHITGTAGKGSTVAFLHEMLRAAGLATGSFTSPFATTSIEKICVDDKLISPAAFARLTGKLKPAIQKMRQNSPYGRPSYFECFLALAFLYFKEQKCEWVILEVGAGGTYDATNVIKKSISAITNIGLDHVDLLGKTLVKIARDKAGIIKPNTHFFTTETKPRLLKIFKKVCQEKNAVFHQTKPALWKKTITAGKYQAENAALATSIAKHIKLKDASIKKGLARAKLPCRFEIIQTDPRVILDGAHNPDKIKSVMHNLKSLTYDKLYIMFASSKNKNARRMVALLEKTKAEFIFTKFNCETRAAFDAEELQKYTRNKSAVEREARQALKKILKKLKRNDLLLITGSFYLAGDLRKHWISEEHILKKRQFK